MHDLSQQDLPFGTDRFWRTVTMNTAKSIHHIHGRGDIKTDNVEVGIAEGRVVILDLGL